MTRIAAGAHIAGVGLRALADADLPALSALYAQTRAAELAPVPWPEPAKQAFLADQFALQHAHYRQHYAGADFLVIERDGALIGRLYVYRSAREIRLMDIALLPECRRQGIATALLHALLDEARADAAAVTLHVEPDNPACALYRRLGFREIERRGVYAFMGLAPLPAGEGLG